MATPYQERKIMDPAINPGDQPYFDAAAQGKLMLKKCNDCGELHHYPRALCPFCFNEKIQWVEAKGKGTLYSYSVMRRAEVPYAIAYVTLDEGPTMMTNLVECDFDRLKIGQRMKVVFTPTDGGAPVPTFTPAS